MSDKLYLSANGLLRDSFRLGKMVLDSGWRPDVLIALWRGGTPVGVAVHEILLYGGVPTLHMALKSRSYTGIGRRAKVVVEHAGEICRPIRAGHRVLVVDDVLDSGCTARAVRRLLLARGAEVRLAVLYWKRGASRTAPQPDYFVRTTGSWIVFPHELEGLTPAEVRRKDPALHALLFAKRAAATRPARPRPSRTRRACAGRAAPRETRRDPTRR